MSKPSLLEANRSYTFRSYFDLGFPVDELLAEFVPADLEVLVRILVAVLELS